MPEPERGIAHATPGEADAGRQESWPRAITADGRLRRHPVVVVLGFVMLGIAATWPRVTYLASDQLPNQRDESLDLWDLWWVAHQAEHFANPFWTHQMFAPVGVPLGYDTLMPLVGLIMMPVTLTAGPALSANLLSLLLPGLACYAMYRAARLWLSPTGSFASAVFFGLSSMVSSRAWSQLNLAAGALFLPLALEAAVRLRRSPSAGRAAALGLVIGLCLLVDTESTVLALMVVAATLAGWLLSDLPAGKFRLLGLAAVAALAVASPVVVAMIGQAGSVASKPSLLARDYLGYSVGLPQMFTPSPKVSGFGLHWLGGLFYDGIPTEGIPTFGVTLTILALLGAATGGALTGGTATGGTVTGSAAASGTVAGWRDRTGIWLLSWLGTCTLALGPVLHLGTTSSRRYRSASMDRSSPC